MELPGKNTILDRIADAMNKIEPGSCQRGPEDALMVRGTKMRDQINIRQRMNRTDSYRATGTGLYDVSVFVAGGVYRSNSKRFPAKKDGSHGYVEIATLLFERQVKVQADYEAQARTRDNQAAAESLAKHLELPFYGGSMIVSASSDPDKPILVRLVCAFPVTVVDAAQVHRLLAQLGVNLTGK